MAEVISVRFRSGCKNYDFDPRGIPVKMGDHVVVETAQGPEFAICTAGNHEKPDSQLAAPLNILLRMATENDHRVVEYNRRRESEAFDICEQKIAQHGLEMKLVRVSANFDGSKIIFFFTADGRVDFRELVRDLAGVFRTRIELRQIGVRDEAKLIGGLGICGRPFCCSEFLSGFMPVSIKMAKTQNLSLNPTKISGTCGRLMCCLKYEQAAYEDAQRRLPKLESFVQTPDGPGNVKGVDLLREQIKVSLDSAPEPLKTYRLSEISILRNGKGSREGIEIPPLTERYIDETTEDVPPEPVLVSHPFADALLEDAPSREKMGVEGSSEGKPRRRHNRSRRPSESAIQNQKLPAKKAEKPARQDKPEKREKSEKNEGKPYQGEGKNRRRHNRPRRGEGQSFDTSGAN